jgi:putative FmdB family regulatory protein
MPLYEFSCEECGRFDIRMAVATATAPCPACHGNGVRVFSAPGGRGPRMRLRLGGAAALARVDRAVDGAPSTGPMPAGVRLDGGGRPRILRSGRGERRPWQLGH